MWAFDIFTLMLVKVSLLGKRKRIFFGSCLSCLNTILHSTEVFDEPPCVCEPIKRLGNILICGFG